MKKLLFGIATIALFLASCTPMGSGSGNGSIKLTLPRALPAQNAGTPQTVTVTLSRYGIPVPLSGNQTVLSAVQDTDIKLDQLNPGAGYRLGVSVGTRTGAIITVNYYAESDIFAVTAGNATDLNLTLDSGVFTFLTTSGNPSSAANVANTLYVQDGGSIGTVATSTPYAITSPFTPNIGGAQITSLTSGFDISQAQNPLPDQLWINTSAGIYSWNGENTSAIINNGNSHPYVKYSKAIVINTKAYWKQTDLGSISTLLAMYNSGGLLVGGIIAPNPDSMTVTTIQGLFGSLPDDLNFTTRLNTKWTSVSDIIAGNRDIVQLANSIVNDVVSDISVNTDDSTNPVIYASSALGTLAITGNMRTALSTAEYNASQPNQPAMDYVGFYQKYLLTTGSGDSAPTIRALSSTGGKLFAGTDKGIYIANMVPAGGQFPDPLFGTAGPAGFSLVPGTDSDRIVAIGSIAGIGVVATAAVSKTGRVYILRTTTLGTTIDAVFPAAAGVPVNAKPLFFKGTGNKAILLLTGDNGAVLYTTDITLPMAG